MWGNNFLRHRISPLSFFEPHYLLTGHGHVPWGFLCFWRCWNVTAIPLPWKCCNGQKLGGWLIFCACTFVIPWHFHLALVVMYFLIHTGPTHRLGCHLVVLNCCSESWNGRWRGTPLYLSIYRSSCFVAEWTLSCNPPITPSIFNSLASQCKVFVKPACHVWPMI